MHRRAGVLEVMVIMFVSMGETQSLPMHEACLMAIWSELQLLSVVLLGCL